MVRTKRAFNGIILFALMVILLLQLTTAAIESTAKPTPKVKHPVIIVPGFARSQVYARNTKTKNATLQHLWLNSKYLLWPSSLSDLMKLTYNEKTLTTENKKDTEIIFPGWGDTKTIEYLDNRQHSWGKAFANMVKELKKDNFFVSGKSIRGAPYDFRKAPNENKWFLDALTKLVEDTYKQNGNRRVVLISHSLGSLYTHWFLKSKWWFWNKKYIEAFVSIGAPFGGAVAPLRSILSGDRMNMPIFSEQSLRPMLRSFPSLAYVLPSTKLWPSNQPIVVTPSANYSAHDMQRLYKDIGFAQGFDMMRNAKKDFDFTSPISGLNKVYCIHGTDVKTVEKITYRPPLWLFRKPFPDQSPVALMGDGDGVVNRRSLELCSGWRNVNHIRLAGAEHNGILTDKRLMKIIKDLIGL